MISRRTLLKELGAGSAMLAMPAFLAACAPKHMRQDPLPTDPFGAWFGVDPLSTRLVLEELSQHGADWAELYFQHSRSTSLSLEDGIVSQASSRIDQGVGLRVVVGDHTGYAFTEDLSLEAMRAAAKSAAAIAKAGPARLPTDFAHVPQPEFYSVALPWSEVGIDQRLPLLERAAAITRALDTSITKVSVNWSDEEQRVLIATLEGGYHLDRRPMSRIWVNVTAVKNGVTRSNSANLAGRRGLEWYTEEKLQLLAKQAVDRTMVLFDARRPPAGELPVVLAAGASGILLHEAVGHGMEADFNRKNISIYADMIARKVAPDFVTIVDDGTVPNERGALNVDDEGIPGQRTVLVEKGYLASYLHDRISAKHYQMKSTGSGRRESFRFPPMPRMRCTSMEDGPHSREEILASVKKGIIAETFTNGQVQIGAGDFTFYIKNGWMIEDGKVTYPISDCNIIGNGPDALRRLTMAANDSMLDTGGWTCGKDGQSVPVSQGLPTVLVSSLTVGGQDG
ncbi:MAG TPA: TldD/PmbA family protein [Myxococcota bacterium]|nr:TldD/PmbA family protein [Myxococcota bacterium]